MKSVMDVLNRIMALTWACSAVCIVLKIHTAHPAFIITPSSQVVGIGQEAVFRCRNPTAINIGWIWNGSAVMSASPPPDITLDSDSLTIVAQLNYNETEVVCLALFRNGSVETPPVRLLIQGPLRMVMKIKRNTSIITWEAPFSLDLTGVDPDIIYCVEVYNITCGVDDLVVGDCNVTEPRFVNNRLQQRHVYRITIIPRSNGQDAQNGTNNTKQEIFTLLTDPRTRIMFRSGSTMIAVVIRFRDDGTGVKPASYFLNLTSIDGTEELSNTLFAMSITQDSNANSTTLRVSEPLPRQRLWKYQILALGCNENPITNLFEISSHDFQNITVSSSSPGEISVTGDFIPGSLAIGILVVVYSADNDSNNTMIKYHFVHRSNIRRTITMTNLPSGQYKVSVFVVEENGLPFNRSATTPRNISLVEGGDVQFFFEYQLHPTSTSVCINCTFLDSSATGCVAVVHQHQRISQLSSSGLMNIESSHRFNRSGDAAYGCIEGINLTDYQIGVFNLVEVVPTPPISPDHVLDVRIIITIIIVVVFLIIAVLLLATTSIIVCYKKRNLSSIQSNMQKKSRVSTSTTLRRLTTDSSTSQMDDEETYDKLQDPVKQLQVTAKEVHMHMLRTEEAAAIVYLEEAHGSAPVYSVLGTHPPQDGVLYSSVNLGPPSGVIGHDDLHKILYSELQQDPQEEESFNKGPGNTYAVTRIDTVTSGDILSDFNDEVVYIFNSAQEYIIPSELTTLLEDTDDNDSTCLLSGECHPSVGSIGVNAHKEMNFNAYQQS